MAQHDYDIGIVLDKLDELGIVDNTIVVYSTDNGTEKFTWPDGGTIPFRGEKGTTWEGEFRVSVLNSNKRMSLTGYRNQKVIFYF